MGRAVNLFATLDQAAARFGDRGAVYLGEQQLHTWNQLRDRALRLAASLRRTYAPGQRIAIASENRAEIVELFYAVWAAECVVVPVNFKLHPREMVQILEDSGAASGIRLTEDRSGADSRVPGRRRADRRRRTTNSCSARRRRRYPRPTRRRWPGCSTPAAPPAAPRARCCRIAT